MPNIFKGLSFKLSADFIPNLVLIVGIIFVRRGTRGLMDKYFVPHDETMSLILSVIIGIFLIYLPEGTLKRLGGYVPQKSLEEIKKEFNEIEEELKIIKNLELEEQKKENKKE